MRVSILVTTCFIILIWGSCTTPPTNVNMKITNPNEGKTIIKIKSSLPTPAPNTMLMFTLLDEKAEYKLPNGETTTGDIVEIFSTDGDHVPTHRVGVGSEFELLGYRYRLDQIVRSEDYTKSSAEAWVEVLGKI